MKLWKQIRQFVILIASIVFDVLLVWNALGIKDFQLATFCAVMAFYLYWQFKEGEK